MKVIQLLIGFALTLGALILAFQFQFKHFYEFLVVGLFVVQSAYLPLSKLTIKTHFYLYTSFLVAGITIDLCLGQWVGNLWFYNYSELWEYWALYVLVYPIAGYVMLWTYLLGLRFYTDGYKNTTKGNTFMSKVLYVFLSVITGGVLLFGDELSQAIILILIFVGVYSFILLVSLLSEWWKGQSFFFDIAERTNVVALIIMGTFLNLIVHEGPNLFAEQWVYTAQTGTFFDWTFLGVQIAFWASWPMLLLGPVALYYLLVSKNEHSKIFLN